MLAEEEDDDVAGFEDGIPQVPVGELDRSKGTSMMVLAGVSPMVLVEGSRVEMMIFGLTSI